MAPFLGALSYLNLNLKKISVPILSRRGSSVTVNVRMLFYATLPANSRRTTTNTNKGHHRGTRTQKTRLPNERVSFKFEVTMDGTYVISVR